MRKPNGYWNIFENNKRAAALCKTRTEFQKRFAGSYDACLKRHGWLDEVCSHMEPVNNLRQRALYAIEFEDNSVYVGLTWNCKARKYARSKAKDYVWKKQQSTKYTIIEFNDWLLPDQAQKGENELIEQYKNSGWSVLNKAKAGGLGGGPSRYSKKKVHSCALQCSKRTEFLRKYSRAYQVALENGWLDEVCSHMRYIKRPNGYLTKGICRTHASLCSSRSEFEKRYRGAYTKARRMNWLDEICSHMEPLRKNNGFWCDTNIKTAASECATLGEFRSRYPRAYTICREKEILDKVCAHMLRKCKPNGYWAEEKIAVEALLYKRRLDFFRNSQSAYNAARRLGVLDKVCSHMGER